VSGADPSDDAFVAQATREIGEIGEIGGTVGAHTIPQQAMIRSRNSPTRRSTRTAWPLVVCNAAPADAQSKVAARSRWAAGSLPTPQLVPSFRPPVVARRPPEEFREPMAGESREHPQYQPP
jgi:hypothetical protein